MFDIYDIHKVTVLEAVNPRNGQIIASVDGYENKFTKAIHDCARVNLDGYMMKNGFGTMWFIPTITKMPLTADNIRNEVNAMIAKFRKCGAIFNVTQFGKSFLKEFGITL